MPSTKLSFTAALLTILLSHAALANSGGEAKPAEGGEGEGAAAAADTGSKEQREFTEKSAKLKTLATRIVDTEKEFQDLVHHKEVTKDPEAIQEILKQMVDTAERRNKAVTDYNKLKMDVELRYPSEGQQESRQYQTQTKKSVEELEGVAGLDELLSRTKKIVEKKFAAFNVPDPKGKGAAGKAKPRLSPEGQQVPGPANDDEKPKRLRLEK